ncbi:NADH-quinone oxidoreductase subunit K [Tessaracoccus coleopterorum]|uniref:NADH-quinone oxidoreductase subunit K n=1 Tax=Tessaracoccus coleopterorum TaxID=2714950 RepID=UPI0038CD726B
MSANLALAITAGILVAAGVYLLLERSLTRILLGVLLTSNGVNMLFLIAAGEPGRPPSSGSPPATSPIRSPGDGADRHRDHDGGGGLRADVGVPQLPTARTRRGG